jgi:hypothetical protein
LARFVVDIVEQPDLPVQAVGYPKRSGATQQQSARWQAGALRQERQILSLSRVLNTIATGRAAR